MASDRLGSNVKSKSVDCVPSLHDRKSIFVNNALRSIPVNGPSPKLCVYILYESIWFGLYVLSTTLRKNAFIPLHVSSDKSHPLLNTILIDCLKSILQYGDVGLTVGNLVGCGDGFGVGPGDGLPDGCGDGLSVGLGVGVGLGDGDSLGFGDGEFVGFGDVGKSVGANVLLHISFLRLPGWSGYLESFIDKALLQESKSIYFLPFYFTG